MRQEDEKIVQRLFLVVGLFFSSLFLFFPFEKGTVVRCTYGENLVWVSRIGVRITKVGGKD